ncbi:GntR family transcriptional regulator [Streptomyces justiciae]|uniref:GntR family transcriptional regulator n=1 Tax=Streptomyces justiciae TaxID=2780140 RepID=UPI001882789A|nr:GntR family transcriptional regulator [Streptomyces justiciae]MBE8478250.1 GntR family transcriptional regulator [Streptomyces justiciae]MCW8375717.1 GntR family transcriptional regulator [Streptomyces justiciae]
MGARENGESGGKEFQRVADALRARMIDGTYVVGSYLPPQRELTQEFVVSRDTIQRALRELADEGWIASRQGSGSRVIKVLSSRPSVAKETRGRHGVTLSDVLGPAFEKPQVTLDVYTLSAESLSAHLLLQVERIHAGEISPEHIALRLLLPDTELALPYPRVKGDKEDLRLQERLRAISRRHTDSLRGLLNDLQTEQLVPSVSFDIRHTSLPPAFKLYVVNGVELLHGMYNVIERQIPLPSGEVVTALDVLGLSATLTRHVRDEDPDSQGSIFVDNMRVWFDSVWNRLSE